LPTQLLLRNLLDGVAGTPYIAIRRETGAMVADIGQSLLDAIADLKTGMEQRFTAVERRFTAVDERLTGMDQRLAGVDERLYGMDQRLAGVDEWLAPLASMRAQLDGLPLINRVVTVTQQEVRALRTAFNDFA
jgi:hypothetical protein